MKMQKLIDSGNWEILENDVSNTLASIARWRIISSLKLPESFILKFRDRVNWEDILRYQNLSVDFIEEHIINNQYVQMDKECIWRFIIMCQNLNEKFLRKYENKIDKFSLWHAVFLNQIGLSESFLNDFIHRSFLFASEVKDLPINIIEKFKNKLNWDRISKYHVLSDEFYQRFKKKLNNNMIYNPTINRNIFDHIEVLLYDQDIRLASRTLSEDMLNYIEKHYIDWEVVAARGDISEEFLIKNKQNINFDGLSRIREYSTKFIIQNHHKINLMALMLVHTSNADTIFQISDNIAINYRVDSATKKINSFIIKNYWKKISQNEIYTHCYKNLYYEDMIKIHHKIPWHIEDRVDEIRDDIIIKFRHAIGIDRILKNKSIGSSIKNYINELEKS